MAEYLGKGTTVQLSAEIDGGIHSTGGSKMEDDIMP